LDPYSIPTDRPLGAEVSAPDQVVSENVSANAEATEQSSHQIFSMRVEIAQLSPGSLINVPYTVTLLTPVNGVPVPTEVSEQHSNLVTSLHVEHIYQTKEQIVSASAEFEDQSNSRDIEQSLRHVVSIPAEIAQLSPSSWLNVPCVSTEPVEPAEQSSNQVTNVSGKQLSVEQVISGPAEVDDHCYHIATGLTVVKQAVSESVGFTEQLSNQVSTVPIDFTRQSAEQLAT